MLAAMPKNVVPMTAKSPQVEDGHIRIANELYDAIVLYPFTARQLKVVMIIMRKTYGYNKKVDDISASQIAAACGLHRSHVTATLTALASLNIISKSAGVYGSIVGLNKNFASWLGWPENQKPGQVKTKPEDGTESVQESQNGTGCTESVQGVPKQLSGGTETVQVDGTESVHTKDNLPKDNLQQTKECAPQADRAAKPARAGQTGRAMTAVMQARFDRFYLAYPKKKSKGAAEKAFARIAPDEELLETMLAAIEVAKRSEDWLNGFIPHPSTWLHNKRWLDEIQTEYTPEQRDIIDTYNDVLGASRGYIDADVFAESRANTLEHFRGLLNRPEFWREYFPYVRDKCDLPPGVGLDYLISREGFTKVKGGQHERKA